MVQYQTNMLPDGGVYLIHSSCMTNTTVDPARHHGVPTHRTTVEDPAYADYLAATDAMITLYETHLRNARVHVNHFIAEDTHERAIESGRIVEETHPPVDEYDWRQQECHFKITCTNGNDLFVVSTYFWIQFVAVRELI